MVRGAHGVTSQAYDHRVATVLFDSVTLSYREGTALSDLTLRVEHGELLVLLGPSGSGKSSVLRLIAGLDLPSSGDVLINGVPVGDIPARERNVAMVFQDNVLFPFLDVEGNVGFPLDVRGLPGEEIEARVHAETRALHIESIMERMPETLSSGQQQLVQAAKAMVRTPDVFLMDEPLARIDPARRRAMRSEFRMLQEGYGTTTVYATNDQEEAMAIADRIAVLDDGKVRQVGPPLEVYNRPLDVFVAGFVGSPQMNVFPAAAAAGTIRLGPVDLETDPTWSGSVTVGVRPADWNEISDGLPVRITHVDVLGADVLAAGESEVGEVTIRMHGPPPRTGDVVLFGPRRYHVFDEATGRAIFHAGGSLR